MYWRFVYWLVTKILWRKSLIRGSVAKVEAGFNLFHWFTPYPEYKGYAWTLEGTNKGKS